MYTIRPYHPDDLGALYEICLRTGDNGSDASGMFADPQLLGHFYAAPYAVLEPDLCFMLTEDARPVGYILGTRDTRAYAAACEASWFPALRARYPLPAPDDTSRDADLIRLIHTGYSVQPDLDAYPAHLHIDLLPSAQGQGFGRSLMQTFLDRLVLLEVPGVHLGVSAANPAAVAFYGRVGFDVLIQADWGFVLGRRL